jgi:cardiolipin hydrolase
MPLFPCIPHRLLDILYAAHSTLDICVFNITCNELADAVIAAHRRGVRVRIITDNDQV